ncbi:MAG: PIN domain-containing protein [Acidobacteriota bacterium]
MILLDTSIWIDLIRNPVLLADVRERFPEFVICGPILQEILQGLAKLPGKSDLREALLAMPRIGDPVPIELFLSAAQIYADGRQRGYTIRSAYDCLIAAIAIENDVAVWHKDRDFTSIARYTSLKVLSESVH